ncbi:MAG: MFS transporter, partial [candidate division Zixibacteria bacterium]|nr:MFS transporter [candidate division Zixibacteria bacterium]
NRNFFLLWQGQLVSQVGTQAYIIAMAFWIKHETASATLMGLILMVSLIPSVVLGPIAGTFADRHSRRKIIIVCDVINGLAVLALAAVVFLIPGQTEIIVVCLFAITVLVSTVSAFFRPAISASIPELVPTEKIAAANSMNQFSLQISTFIGQGAGGVLFRVLGAPLLFLIDGLSYLFSAFSESFITIPQVIPKKSSIFREKIREFARDTREGFTYMWRNRGLRFLVLTASFLNFLIGPVVVLLPFFVEDFLQTTSDWYGYIMAGFGAGAMAGFLAAGAIKFSGRVRGALTILSLILMSALVALLGHVPNQVAALVIAVMMGMTSGFFNINVSTILQLTTPSEIRGRVFAVLGTISGGLMPLAMGLTGVIADLLGQNIPLIFALCGGGSLALTVAVTMIREFREYLAFERPSKNAEAEQA